MSDHNKGDEKPSRTDILWVCDCSNSMKGKGKSGSMNTMIREIIQELNENPPDSSLFEVNMRALKFFDTAEWINLSFIPVKNFSWIDLVPGGNSKLGDAFKLINEEFKQQNLNKDNYDKYQLLLILITDGYPTDDWIPEFEDMKDVLNSYNPVYCLIRIQDTSDDIVSAFAGEGNNKDLRIMTCDDIENIIQLVRLAEKNNMSN